MHKKVLSHASHSFRMKLKPALLEYPGTRFLWRDQTLLLSSDKLLPLCMTMTNLSTYSSQQKLACCVLGKSHEYLLSHQNACKLLVLGNKYIAFLLRPLLQCSYNMMVFENWNFSSGVRYKDFRAVQKTKWMYFKSESWNDEHFQPSAYRSRIGETKPSRGWITVAAYNQPVLKKLSNRHFLGEEQENSPFCSRAIPHGTMWILFLWRYSRPAWMRSCAACSGWPCFGRGVGLDDPQRALPTPTILSVCNC